jgi:hypothetical protein
MPGFEQHPAAWQEYEEAARYYAAIHPELALDFEDAIADRRDRIRAAPFRFAVRKFNVRRVNLAPQFKEWFLAYIIWRERPVIVAVGHAKRRPYYFLRRIDQAREMF